MDTIQPSDDAAHLDGVLMAELTALNESIARYVVRLLDADAGRAEPVSTENERLLAERMTMAAEGMRRRAERREEKG